MSSSGETIYGWKDGKTERLQEAGYGDNCFSILRHSSRTPSMIEGLYRDG